MMASAHCSVTGLTAVTGWPEQGKSWISAFPVSETVILFVQRPTVLLLTAALP